MINELLLRRDCNLQYDKLSNDVTTDSDAIWNTIQQCTPPAMLQPKWPG